ncbi:MAG: hypothetical protein L0J74_09440 [Corynebacterium sp.]|uniref:hypothetical protein n=1 Tax=Corynebacterium TaxID=1716 RepID=UPI0026479A46|nr:hypothetical protein [Corynebacterium sp.]MDN5721726.1 hypothetical protein [Corynebacterium sp.]MDN6281944.1 hypothetical protein [Corynebacterium sp.]MDN6306005.1 hypothetical protein [Corynebacterium sp.]MDN6367847.1 hypothetical protein [Corynebacterium sp.]MDN6375330.1 hypothetical protein [Corynebacterium sp.]
MNTTRYGIAAMLTAGALLAPAALADAAEDTATADTTETVPDLPELQGVDGSAGSLLNNNLGTGDQLFCAELGAQLAELSEQWNMHRIAHEVAVGDGDDAAAAAARAAANTVRLVFTNANAANLQCLTAAHAALTSSPSGSFAA